MLASLRLRVFIVCHVKKISTIMHGWKADKICNLFIVTYSHGFLVNSNRVGWNFGLDNLKLESIRKKGVAKFDIFVLPILLAFHWYVFLYAVFYFLTNQNKFGWLKVNCSHFAFSKFFPCRLTVLFKLSKKFMFFCLSSVFVSLLGLLFWIYQNSSQIPFRGHYRLHYIVFKTLLEFNFFLFHYF